MEEPYSVEVVEVLVEPLEGCSKDWSLWKKCQQLHQAEEEQAGLLKLAHGPLSVAVSPGFGW